MIPVGWYFLLASGLFVIGIYLVLSSKNAIRVLMGIELMLNAANVNFAAFSGFNVVGPYVNSSGFTFAFFSIAIAAAEAAVGLAIFINLFRLRQSPNVDRANVLRW